MKVKKVIIIISACILFFAVFFAPIQVRKYDDGGTNVYSSLTYTVVDWRRLISGGIYEKTDIFWFGDSHKSIDTYWKQKQWQTIELTITETMPYGAAIENKCFYAYDTEGLLYRIICYNPGQFCENQIVTVSFDKLTELKYPNGYPSGWVPKYQINAISVS